MLILAGIAIFIHSTHISGIHGKDSNAVKGTDAARLEAAGAAPAANSTAAAAAAPSTATATTQGTSAAATTTAADAAKQQEEQKRKEEEQRKQQEEQKRKEEEEKKRKEEEQKKREEEERKKKEEEDRRKREEEEKRKKDEEEKKQREEEEKRQQEQLAREAEEKQQQELRKQQEEQKKQEEAKAKEEEAQRAEEQRLKELQRTEEAKAREAVLAASGGDLGGGVQWDDLYVTEDPEMVKAEAKADSDEYAAFYGVDGDDADAGAAAASTATSTATSTTTTTTPTTTTTTTPTTTTPTTTTPTTTTPTTTTPTTRPTATSPDTTTTATAAELAAGGTARPKRAVDDGPTDYYDDGDLGLLVEARPGDAVGDYGAAERRLEVAVPANTAAAAAAAAGSGGAGAGAVPTASPAAAAAAGAGGQQAGAAATAVATVDATALADAADPWVNTTQGCGELSRELLERWAVNGTVLLAFTNSIMWHNFGDTWLYHVKKAGIKYWVLAVADNHTAHLVHSRGAHHCFMAHENEIDDTNATFKWGSTSWKLHTWQKVLVVRHVHLLGFNVINSDIDVVWMRDPLQHFLVKYPLPDYWVSMDPITTRNPIGDDGPEAGITVHHYMNTGVYFLRNTPGGTALIDKWYEIRKPMQMAGYHDQDGLYQYLSKNPEDIDFNTRIAKVLDGRTRLAQLPASLFQNGYSHCINQVHKVHGWEKPFEVHFVWVWGGNAGKMMRMREQQYFIDEPQYYAGPLFVSYDVVPITDPPGYNDWNDTEAMVSFHLDALDRQLTDAWHGIALAGLLNRTLILPKMKCYCIQNWFENPLCRLPGEPLTKFPLQPACPADFIFNMDPLMQMQVQGHTVPVREFSFLDNERTPAVVKDQPLIVTADPAATAASGPAASPEGPRLTIPSGLPSDRLLATLAPFLGTSAPGAGPGAGDPPKRLHFTNPRLAFGGWAEQGTADAYQAMVDELPIRWCCRPIRVAQQHGKTEHHFLKIRRAKPDGSQMPPV
ncbi:hypothetical protein HYH03_009739 [Edaphochlamys debaryana]|uniref:Nucleotide-diphospho-sugar transferase domain-containing protein n=1 Tax=Edaphochlamys debaryana TaxID=47281 RepID=A0A836BY94_9CHLO|nr:hypothetical protein HYH03_009739 [Edaphochlamys debaryana]|eukprot:KAG2492009.1 hypothetical protein HYH03_009739 [Edaphochlamys debaryana]